MPAHAYRGRRIFQSVIAAIGTVIIVLAIMDLNREDRSISEMGPNTPKIAQDLKIGRASCRERV